MDDKQHHVLIVDDVQDNLDLLQRILEGWDYSVGFALDGFAALDLARQNPFDAIILDIMMPGIDGIETCRRIREDLELHTVPIIMLTGMDDNTTLAKCLEVGADDFIAKPFNRIVLRARLESAIRRKELEDVILNTNQYLEQKVSERTSELFESNRQLQKEIQLRRLKEQELVDFQEQLADIVVQKTRDLEQSRDRALSAEKAMSGFLANMTHELRTPLHSILSFTRFGLAKAEAEKVDIDAVIENFHEIQSSGEVLLGLINNLLDLSKLKSGKMAYEFQAVNLNDILNQVINEFSVLQEEKWIFIKNEIENTELDAELDIAKISQVLRNLLSNALKFSPDNTVVRVCHRETDNNLLEISIIDQGPGIPESELESIFDNFSQSSNTSSNAGGTGLGLSICKEIIEQGHRGLIWASNNPDAGATFTLSLPRHQRLESGPFWQGKQA